jgi:hypothetical protein
MVTSPLGLMPLAEPLDQRKSHRIVGERTDQPAVGEARLLQWAWRMRSARMIEPFSAFE